MFDAQAKSPAATPILIRRAKLASQGGQYAALAGVEG